MLVVRALLALIGVILLFAAGFGVAAKVHLAILGAACLALAYELPTIQAGL